MASVYYLDTWRIYFITKISNIRFWWLTFFFLIRIKQKFLKHFKPWTKQLLSAFKSRIEHKLFLFFLYFSSFKCIHFFRWSIRWQWLRIVFCCVIWHINKTWLNWSSSRKYSFYFQFVKEFFSFAILCIFSHGLL